MRELDAYRSIAESIRHYQNECMILSGTVSKLLDKAYNPSLPKTLALLNEDLSKVAELQLAVSRLDIVGASPALEFARSANASISHVFSHSNQ